jgi:hypothetical protein
MSTVLLVSRVITVRVRASCTEGSELLTRGMYISACIYGPARESRVVRRTWECGSVVTEISLYIVTSFTRAGYANLCWRICNLSKSIVGLAVYRRKKSRISTTSLTPKRNKRLTCSKSDLDIYTSELPAPEVRH